MRKLLLGMVALIGLSTVGALANYAMTQGSGTTFASSVIGSVHYVQMLLCDATAGGTQCAAVSSGGAVKVDGSAVTQPVSGTVTANLGTLNGAATAANQTGGGQKSQQVDGSGNVAPVGDTAARAPFTKVTDGTNGPAAVKPASTAAATTDPSLVTNESPNSQISVAAGTTADSAWAGSGNASIIAALKGIYNNLTGSTPGCAQTPCTTTIGNVGIDPSGGKGTPSSVPINVSTATTTQLVAISGTTSIYVTSYDVIAGGAGNITFEYGTGSACGTGTTPLTGAYPLVAQAGIAKGDGTGTVLKVPAGNALCVLTSASVQYSGSVSYQQF
jgi:hypothetical protein